MQDGTTGTTSSVEPMEVVEVPVQADAQGGSTHLHIPQTIAIQPNMSSVKIAGVTVERDSAISVLKAACGYLQVCQSGANRNCGIGFWQRWTNRQSMLSVNLRLWPWIKQNAKQNQ